MSLPLPSSLTPSKIASFKDCALAFRLANIDRLPEAPSPYAVKGTLVHKALELLFSGGPRTRQAARRCLDDAWELVGDQIAELEMDREGSERFRDEARALVDAYFTLEDPTQVEVVGTEMTLEVVRGDLRLRGIIDRLERDPDGSLVVSDYKTGRVPHQAQEQSRFGGLHFYAYLCQEALGELPGLVQLLYLAGPTRIAAVPTEQSVRAMARRATAVWSAIERACRDEDFRPHPSGLCAYCSFRAYCPAFGGQLPASGA